LTIRKAIHLIGSVPTTINTLREILKICRLADKYHRPYAVVISDATDLSIIKKTTEYVKSKIRVHLA
jgi:hypothetical protein